MGSGMLRCAPAAVMCLLNGCALGAAPQSGSEPPKTVAERTDYRDTSRLADVDGYLKDLAARSKRVRLGELGKTGEGRSIPLAIIAEPPLATPDEARKSGKLVVLLNGGIHSGECDGKEALLALARELVLGEHGDGKEASPLLKDLVIVLVPLYNADGNEHVGPSSKLRPGQKGPDEVGVRENAPPPSGLDLNRDFVKLEAPETRALVKCINEWDPAVVVDTHTTNGSLHRYLLTYDGPKNPAGDAEVIDFVRDSFFPSVGKRAKDRGHFDTFWYGNFEQDHTRWETYPDGPRYGINYVGMRNRVAILTESYSYAPYAERVRAQHDFVLACLEEAVADRETITRLEHESDRRAADGKRNEIPVRSKMVAAPEKVKALGYVEEQRDGHAVAGEPRDYDVDLFARFEAEKTVTRPYAYLYPARLTSVTENLQRHGIRVEETREDIELDVSAYAIEAVTKAVRPFQGHDLVTVKAAPHERSGRFDAGMMLVRSEQKLGALAAFLLEPESIDGLTTWNFFDTDLKIGDDFPIVRLEKPVVITATPAPDLNDEHEPPKPITFEAAYESDHGPNLNGSSPGQLVWVDDDHFVQTKDGTSMTVEAATGRYQRRFDAKTISKIAASLRELPTIDARSAESIAHRPGLMTDKAGKIAVFEHQNDLYEFHLDGTGAARLTNSPARKENPSLSPDGKFVAFVKQNDLWVTDIATHTERALTTGGTDLLRNGKNDWVYFEEVFNRNWQAYWWSPDSTRIAYLQIDDAPVKLFPVVNDPAKGDPKIEMTPYPKPGAPNPRAKLFTVNVAGGDAREVDLSEYSPEDVIVTNVGWWPDSSKVYAYVTNRVQSRLDIETAPADGGEPHQLLRETTKAWVDTPPALKFLKDGSFLLFSEQTGWRHLYHYSGDGKLIGPVTHGAWEVRSLAAVDEEGGRLLVSGTLDSPIAENLYGVALDGEGEPTRLTTGHGGHRADPSPGGKYFVDSWSSVSETPHVALFDGHNGKLVRTLDTNPVRDLDHWRIQPTELVHITTPDGFVLEGTVMKPTGFDPASDRKYPVWFMTYGGPHAPTVSDSWGGGRIWDQVLASAGFIVFHCDPRSASGKGAESAWVCYKRFGVPETADIATAIRWIGSQPGIDASRIGMSGHSYGGFMTSYCLTHEPTNSLFAAGIAGAPVTDWHDYDSIYTERYMLTPQDNPEGYKSGSVVSAAPGLRGRLLLIHGLIDDNVHFENTSRLARALQEARKQFDLMTYPDSRHGIGGRQYQRLQYDFIVRTLGEPGAVHPQPSESEGQGASKEERPRRRRDRQGP